LGGARHAPRGPPDSELTPFTGVLECAMGPGFEETVPAFAPNSTKFAVTAQVKVSPATSSGGWLGNSPFTTFARPSAARRTGS
jgi:hypothetical protein